MPSFTCKKIVNILPFTILKIFPFKNKLNDYLIIQFSNFKNYLPKHIRNEMKFNK